MFNESDLDGVVESASKLQLRLPLATRLHKFMGEFRLKVREFDWYDHDCSPVALEMEFTSSPNEKNDW